MSTGVLPRRHALGLPAGSIRAAHVLGIVGLICALLLIPTPEPSAIPPYLVYLLFMLLGHFFAAHGVSIAPRSDPAPSPLYLPGGLVRLLVMAALIATVSWKLYDDPDRLHEQYERTLNFMLIEPLTPVLLIGGFFVGILVRTLVGRTSPPQAWQDLEAWFSILALVGIGVASLIHLIIEPSRSAVLRPGEWEAYLGTVIAFYFGARS